MNVDTDIEVRRAIDGFKIEISDNNGNCLLKTDTTKPATSDNVLKFGEDFTASCKLTLP